MKRTLYMSIKLPSKLSCIIFALGVQTLIFIGYWYYFSQHPQYKCACKKFQITFPLAKTSASLINANIAFLIIGTIQFYRKYIFVPFSFKFLHYIFVTFIYIWSITHIVSHYINLSKYYNFNLYFSWGVGFTGHFLTLVLIAFFIFSMPVFRQHFFHKFIVIHNVLFAIFISFIFIHSTFCFIKTDKNQCPIFLSWLWFAIPLIVFLAETLVKYMSPITHVHNFTFHNPELLEINLDLPQSYVGKQIWICCPDISYFEWHPFCTYKAQSTQSHSVSVIIKDRGNWCHKLHQTFRDYNKASVRFLIHGPFLAHPKNFIDTLQNKDCILVSSGVGITSFVHVLDQLQYVHGFLHFIIIVQSPDEIHWITNTLSKLQDSFWNFSVHFYFTQSNSNFTQSEFPLDFSNGRPNFDQIFNPDNFLTLSKVHVYHSGVPSISKSIQNALRCDKLFDFHKVT